MRCQVLESVAVVEEQWFTVEQVAERLQVNRDTVRRWLREGQLRGRLLGKRAGYRISSEEVRRFMREGLPDDR